MQKDWETFLDVSVANNKYKRNLELLHGSITKEQHKELTDAQMIKDKVKQQAPPLRVSKFNNSNRIGRLAADIIERQQAMESEEIENKKGQQPRRPRYRQIKRNIHSQVKPLKESVFFKNF